MGYVLQTLGRNNWWLLSPNTNTTNWCNVNNNGNANNNNNASNDWIAAPV